MTSDRIFTASVRSNGPAYIGFWFHGEGQENSRTTVDEFSDWLTQFREENPGTDALLKRLNHTGDIDVSVHSPRNKDHPANKYCGECGQKIPEDDPFWTLKSNSKSITQCSECLKKMNENSLKEALDIE